MIGIKFEKVIKSLVLIMPKISGYVKTFKVREGNYKLMCFRKNNEKLFEKYKAIWPKAEDLKIFQLNALPFYDNRFVKNKLRSYGDKVYTNFCGLNVPDDDIECESWTVISINFLLVFHDKYYLQVHLDNYVYKIINKQMTDYLDEHVFED